MNDLIHWVIDGLITITGAVVVYLLQRRDETQEGKIKDIKDNIVDLYQKHTGDADRLQELELEVAKKIFTKDEINHRFEEQKAYFDKRFDRIEKLLDDIKK